MKNVEVLNVRETSLHDDINTTVMSYKTLKNGQEKLYFGRANQLFSTIFSNPIQTRAVPLSLDEFVSYVKVLEDRIIVATEHFVVVLDSNERVICHLHYAEGIRLIDTYEYRSLIVIITHDLKLQFINLNETDIDCSGRSEQVNLPELTVSLEAIGWGDSEKQFQGKKYTVSNASKSTDQQATRELACNLVDPTPNRPVKELTRSVPPPDVPPSSSDLIDPEQVLNDCLEYKNDKVSVAWHKDGSQIVINYVEKGERVIKTVCRETMTALNEGRNLNIFPEVAYNGNSDTIIVLSVDPSNSFRLLLLEDNGEVKSHIDPYLYEMIRLDEMYFDNDLNILLIKYYDVNNTVYMNFYLTCGSTYYLSNNISHPAMTNWAFTKFENTLNMFKFTIFTKSCEKITYLINLNIIRSPVCYTNIVVKYCKADLYVFCKEVPAFEFPSWTVHMNQPIKKATFHPELPIFAVIDDYNEIRIYEQVDYDEESGFSGIRVDTLAEYSFTLDDRRFISAAWTDKNTLSIYAYTKGKISSRTEIVSSFNIVFVAITDDLIVSNRIDSNTYNQINIVKENELESTSESILKSDYGPLDFIRLTHVKLLVNGDLVVNKRVIANNVSSYMTFKNYLLFTTNMQTLIYVRITEVIHSDKFEMRSIEAGTIIVGLDGQYGRAIVTMPRGNFETITNLYYTFDYLKKLAVDGDFITIAEVIRMERLHANVLVELDPNSFLASQGNYVDFINKSNAFINCIIDLTFDNVLNTNYSKYTDFLITLVCKRKILREVLSVLENLDLPFLPLRAFLLFKLNKHSECFNCIAKALGANAQDIAIKIIKALWTVSTAEQIRQYAYLTYDPSIIDFVYQQTNLDPAGSDEDLQSMFDARTKDPFRFRYECNYRSGNFVVALSYLIRSSDATAAEIIDVAQRHNLLENAYDEAKHTKFHAEVGAAWARRLAQHGDHTNAARIYMTEELYGDAIREYANDGNYTMINTMLDLTSQDAESIKALYESSIRALKRHRRFTEAAQVAFEYLKDGDQAIDILCSQNLFCVAKQFAMPYGDRYMGEIKRRMQNVERHYCLRTQSISAELHSSFNRLMEIRSARYKRMYQQDPDNDDGGKSGGKDDDTASSVYAPSSSRASSKRSRSTAKSQRKENLKKTALKKDGFYEDIAIIRNIHKNIELLNDTIKSIVTTFGYPELERLDYVTLMQSKTKSIYDWLNMVIPVIWPEQPEVEREGMGLELLRRYEVATYHFADLEHEFKKPPNLSEIYITELPRFPQDGNAR